MLQEILVLLKLQWKLEFRQRASIAGVLLFAIGSVYLFSLAFGNLEARLWNALFWILLLFSATNALSQAFQRELNYRFSYYAQVCSPLSLFVAKASFNTFFLLVMSTMVWGALSLFFGNQIKDSGLFLLTVLLGCLGFSLLLSFLALIAGRVKNGTSIVAMLAFPVSIPLLLTLVKLGAVSVRVIRQTSTDLDLLLLFGLDLLIVGVAILLSPVLWREA